GAARMGSRSFLKELESGRSYITNEPFLEFTIGDAQIGDTITRTEVGSATIRGRAVGRSDFVRLQAVYNGKVIHEVRSRSVSGHFEATMEFAVPLAKSGWL